MGLETILKVATLTASAASAVSQSKAASSQRKASRLQQQKDSLAAVRQRIDTVRASRIQSANTMQAGENQGVVDSSTLEGALGSTNSQNNANLSFLDQSVQFDSKIGEQRSKAQTWAARSDLFGDISSLTMAAIPYVPKKAPKLKVK